MAVPAELEPVLSQYRLKVLAVEPLGEGMYRVESDRGCRWLHEAGKPGDLFLQFAVTEHLARRGFRRIPRHIRTLYGDPQVAFGEKVYALTDAWEGEIPQTQAQHLALAAANLADLHRALAEAPPELAVLCPQRHGTWLATFARCRDQLLRLLCRFEEEGQPDAFQKVLLQEGPWLCAIMDHSLALLLEGDYEGRAQQRQEEGTLCYGEYRLEHLRVLEDGNLATLRFTTVAGDMPLYDLARFCQLLLDEGKGEFLPIVLAAYAQRRPLDQQEKQILQGYWHFPHSIYRICMAYHHRSALASAYAEVLQKALTRWKNNQPYIHAACSEEGRLPWYHG